MQSILRWIHNNRSTFTTGLASIAALCLLGLAWRLFSSAGFGVHYSQTQSELIQLQQQKLELTKQLNQAKQELEKLRGETVYLKQTQNINEEACKAVRGALGALEDETAKQRQQLAICKGIANPKDLRAGVRIQDLSIQAEGNHYHYELVLLQSVREETRIAGNAEIRIVGNNMAVKGSPEQTLAVEKLVSKGDRRIIFSFKYFEQFEGDFTLPANFRPSKVIVTLKAVNNRPMTSAAYYWSSLIAAP